MANEIEKAEGGKMKARDIAVGANGITFTNAAEVMAFARMMADSEHAVPKHLRGNPGACLAVIDDAIRFGMSPYALGRESYLVTSKSDGEQSLAYMAKAIAGIVIKRAPLTRRPALQYDGEGPTRRCTVIFHVIGGYEIPHTSPMLKDVRGKSPLWASDPDQQLGYYTLRAGARLHFPDVLMGLYDLDEMAEARATTRSAQRETSGLAERLPGAQQGGFAIEHVEREIAEAAQSAAMAATAHADLPETIQQASPVFVTGLSTIVIRNDNDQAAFQMFQSDLADAQTVNEVRALRDSYLTGEPPISDELRGAIMAACDVKEREIVTS